ncbi:unnamed protein product [Durusdinium trenchii]|uniref:Uncharacterized protein n=1 Tax=Durusdinium trenchii TaxID=1381693 RepID=A0ABP0IFP0_9DINO
MKFLPSMKTRADYQCTSRPTEAESLENNVRTFAPPQPNDLPSQFSGGGGNLHDVFADLVGLFLLWLQFYVFMEVLLRRRALCAALVLVLRLGGFHSGFAVGSTYKITFLQEGD